MNSLSNLVFQRRKFLREDEATNRATERKNPATGKERKGKGEEREREQGTASGGGGGDGDGGQWRWRGEPEPEMAARWLLLLLALLAAHVAALPDFIRIGEYLSSGFHFHESRGPSDCVE